MLGHCHPRVTAAIAEQAETLTLCPNYLYNDKRAEFAQALVDVLPRHLPHVFLANSGAEAVDGALKFARLVTKRPAFVATTKGFHGRTMGALSVTWEPKYREGFLPLLETTHVQYNDSAALDKAITDTTAAVILEVVQGESGVNVGTPDFLHIGAAPVPRARRAADRRRDPDRLRAHRHVVRDRACRHRARHDVPGQGPRRRLPDGRVRLHQGDPRRVVAGRARQHLRRLAARVRRRPCRDRRVPRRRADQAQRHARRQHAQHAARRARRRRGGARHPRARPDDRRRAAHQGGAGVEEPDAQSRRDRAARGADRAPPAAAARHQRKRDRLRRAGDRPRDQGA